MGIMVVHSRTELERALTHATTMARAEILIALRAPQSKLVTLLKARSDDLREREQLEAYIDEVSEPEWGLW